MELMVQAGLTPMQVITAATGSAARFLHADELGTLQAGKWADMIVLDGIRSTTLRTPGPSTPSTSPANEYINPSRQPPVASIQQSNIATTDIPAITRNGAFHHGAQPGTLTGGSNRPLRFPQVFINAETAPAESPPISSVIAQDTPTVDSNPNIARQEKPK